MKKIQGKLLLMALSVLLFACKNPLTDNAHKQTTQLSRPGKIIKEFNFAQAILPKSLQTEAERTNSRNAKNNSRAINDVTTITDLDKVSIKSPRYLEFRKNLEVDPFGQSFIDAIKTSSVIKNETLELDTETDLGTVRLYLFDGGYCNLTNSGKIKAQLSDDGSYLKVFWTMNMPNPNLEDMQKAGNDITG